MLRVAVPNKGSLAEAAVTLLRDSGYRQRTDTRDLTVVDDENEVTFFYLRPKDIATYVADSLLHLGITGQDLTKESGASVAERLGLGFGASKFCYAGPKRDNLRFEDLKDKRIATSYPHLVRAHLAIHGVRAAEVIRLDGAVEISVQLGVADAIADVVGSGRTLEQHGLAVIGPAILESEAVLVERLPKPNQKPDPPDSVAEKDRFVERLRGVVYARRYLMVDYDCPLAKKDDAIKLTPGLLSPTVASLADQEWVAIRSMVARNEVNRIMDLLAKLGCRAILSSEIRSCRALGVVNGELDPPR